MPADRIRPEHHPQGYPRCSVCGELSRLHRERKRQEHHPIGDPCDLCGCSADSHRKRKRGASSRGGELQADDDAADARGLPPVQYIGIDGEGQGRGDHRYVMLAAGTADRKDSWVIQAPPLSRLSTAECLRFIVDLPHYRTKVFAYSFNYDLTKMLGDLDNESLYYLFRPDLRQRKGEFAKLGPWPVKWVSERGEHFRLNLQGTKFTVHFGKKRAVVWDLFKFYGTAFTKALRLWKVGSDTVVTQMERMKKLRAEFDKMSREEVLAYCLEECGCLAELGERLINAHTQVGLKLKSFYGAGSSGAAMLTAMGILDKIVPPLEQMKEAVACAFSGGRFENSVIGFIPGPLESKDISSAYPYHTTFLPCLVHGTWRHTKRREDLDGAPHACVRYGMRKNPGYGDWGPFPFREQDGSISYPIESGGGWVWLHEYRQGEKLFEHVYFKEAWVYKQACDCQPFAAIPTYYRLRLKLGKEGPGIVIKLGVNSVYGKLAQTLGSARFNSWIWAGIITSGCRSQVLEVLGLHKDRKNMLMVATDGVVSRESIVSPLPRDTDTGETGKPLGGWETKTSTDRNSKGELTSPGLGRGMFFARPGIYFPIDPTDKELDDIRGRGVGKDAILKNWKAIMDGYESHGMNKSVRLPDVSRFCGAKTTISRGEGAFNRARHKGGILPAYGQWIARPVEMDFNPLPKRAGVLSAAMGGDGQRLELRRFPRKQKSVAYGKAMRSKEAIEMKAFQLEMSEQPEGDAVDYEPE